MKLSIIIQHINDASTRGIVLNRMKDVAREAEVIVDVDV